MNLCRVHFSALVPVAGVVLSLCTGPALAWAAVPRRRLSPEVAVRAAAFGGSGVLAAPVFRTRGGEAKPGPQPCLTAEGS